MPTWSSPAQRGDARRLTVGGKGLAEQLGRGKGAKGMGLGKGVAAKRHRKLLKDNIMGVTKGDIRRLARRGGVKRISGTIYDEVRNVVKIHLETIMKDVVAITEHCKRKTVTVTDVIFALRRQGRPIYGFDRTGTELKDKK